MKLSVSHHWKNKDNLAPERLNKKTGEMSNLYANAAFENRDWTTKQIADHVRAGKAICPAELENGWRSGENFISAQLVGLDFDASPGIDALTADPFIRQYAFLIYPTPSHTDAQPRHRVLFALDEAITDADQYERLMRRLVAKYAAYGVDTGCTDPVRKWNGSTVKGGGTGLDKVLPLSVLEGLPETDEEIKAKQPREPRPVYKPSDDLKTRRVEGYSRAAVEGIYADTLANDFEGMRHNAFRTGAYRLIAIAKGDGWLGIDPEGEARALGKSMGREDREIEDLIKWAHKKADPRDMTKNFDEDDSAPPDAPEGAEMRSTATPTTTAENGANKPPAAAPGLTWKTSADGMELLRDRLVFPPSARNAPTPIPFPFTTLHRFAGMCQIVKPGYVMAVAGGSGTTKTGFVETLADNWKARHGVDVLSWGIEMDVETSADRQVQRYGGPTVTEMWLHELWLEEEHLKLPTAARSGVRLHPARIEKAQQISGRIEHEWAGMTHQIDAPEKDIRLILEATADRTADLRKQGRKPLIAIFDYVQLLDLIGARSEAEKVSRLSTLIKFFCKRHVLFGIVVSQVTKDAASTAKKSGELLAIEKAQNFRGDEYNLAITLNPVYDEVTKEISRQGIIRVDKNTFGRPGQVKVWIEPSRYTWLDKEVDEDAESDEMYVEARQNGRKDHDN